MAERDPSEPPDAPPPSTDRLVLGPAGAQLAAWTALAVVGSVFIDLAVPVPAAGRAVRVLHHAYDAGQILGAGLAASALVEAWLRWGPKRRLWGYLVVAALSVGLSRLVLGDDVSGVAERLTASADIERWVLGLSAVTALCIPAAVLAASLLVRWKLRLLGVAAGIALGIANYLVLQRGYTGLHLYAAWTAATLIGCSVAGLRLPAALAVVRDKRRLGLALRAVLAVAAAASLLVRPSSSVLIELFKVPGAPFAAFVARLQEGIRSTAAVRRPDAWFVDRRAFASVPASSPRMLPSNGVVLLLVVDCLRADVLASSQHAAALPVLNALAQRSIAFERTWTTAPATAVAMASVFAGRYYSQLYWRRAKLPEGRSTYLPDRDPSPRFPELLGEKGVVTVTIAATPGLRAETGVLGKFAEHASLGTPGSRAEGEEETYATARDLADHIIARLRAVGDRPLFLYAQFVDAHGPFNAAGTHGTDFERYLRVLGLIDTEIGRVLAAVAELRLGDRTAIIVTADHGEAFGEHNDRYHGRTLYEVGVRVPLLFAVPGARASSIADPASLIDLGPTILDLFGVPTPGSYMGQSLVPLLRGKDWAPTRPIVMDSGRLQQAMVFPDSLKIIRDKRRGVAELYDLSTDPSEGHNLFDERPELAEQRLGLLQAFFDAHELRGKTYKTPYRPP